MNWLLFLALSAVVVNVTVFQMGRWFERVDEMLVKHEGAMNAWEDEAAGKTREEIESGS